MKDVKKLRLAARRNRMSKRRAGRLEQLEDRRMMAVIEPVAVNDTYQVGIDQTLNIGGPGVLANDSGSALAAHLFTGPTNGTLTLTEDGSFSYTPNPGYSGLDSFLYWASEGDASSMLAAVSITVRAQNDVPVVANDAYSAAEDTPLTGATSVLANDTDPNGDPLIATLVSEPQHGTVVFNSDGTFTYTPNANYHGIDGFSYVAGDGVSQSEVASATITIASVNDVPVASDDALELNEDTSLSITPSMILGNDVDEDGVPLTISIVEQPTHGQLVLNEDGTYSYTPDANYYGSDSFTYTANDGTASSNTATVSITIAPMNDAPIANNDEVTIAEDGSLVIDTNTLLANDSDPDGDTLTLTIVSNPVYGTLVNNGDGTFTYTPNADFSDVDGFTYTISDGAEVSSVATVTINVTPVNDAPVAVGDAFEVDEDTTLTVDLPGILANDSDVDSTSLTATLVDNPLHGELTLNPDGTFSYTPGANFHGSDSFTYTVSDGASVSELATVTITVNPINDAPLTANDEYTVDEDTTLTIGASTGILANDSDPDGDALTATLVSGPQSGTLELLGDGSFVYTPDANFSGVDGFTYTVSDGTATSNVMTVTLNVTSTNDAPLVNNDTVSLDEDTTLVIDPATLLANDSDPDGDPLTITISSQPEHGTLTLNDDGTYSYTPNDNYFGQDGFSYLVSDGAAQSSVASVTITVNSVNDAPVVASDSYTVDEDATLTMSVPGVLANDSDVDGDAFVATLVTGPDSGTLEFNSDGSFTYTPEANYHGTVSFTYTVNDGTVDSTEATVTIEVLAVNDAPLAAEDAYEVDEDSSLNIPGPGVLANDTDLEGDSLTAVLVTGPAHGSLTLNSDGSFTYTPSANYNGNDSFTYVANDGTDESAETTVSIVVHEVPDAPIVNDDAFSIGEDSTLNGNITDNDFDPQGLALSVELISGPTHGTLTLSAGGSFTYVPDANYAGEDSFTYKATNGVEESVVTSAKITIDPINDVPVAAGNSYAVTADSALVVTTAEGVLANDTDVESTSLTARLLLGPKHGTLSMASDGSFVYTPAAGYTGEDRFFYQASDGVAYSNVVQVLLTVGEGTGGGEENVAPVANGDTYTVVTGQTLTIDGPGVLNNDTDADGDTLSAVLLTNPAHGSLTLGADGSLQYTPEAGYIGEDSFTYAANDGTEAGNTATVVITVRDATIENVAPLAQDDTVTTSINTPLVISAPGVLHNDSDLNGDPLTAAIQSQPAHGTVTLNNDGSFTYTPNADYSGNDSFTYVASDGVLSSNVATVNVNISSVDNTRPNAFNDQYQTNADTVLNVPGVSTLDASGGVGVLANDSDAQSDAMTAVLFSAPQFGTVTLNPNGSFSYTPNAGFVGRDSFVYRAFDGVRYSALAAVTIHVNAVPEFLSLAMGDNTLDAVAGAHDEEDAWMTSAVDAFFGHDGDLLA